MTDTRLPAGMTRRTAVGGMLGTAALAAAVPGLAHTPGRKPNILFIMADDLGYADLSCYGRRDYQTPYLDALAREGMMFTHSYANSAVCTATRVGLITGRYQYRLPIGLREPLGVEDVGLPPEHPTIASLLRDAGYRTSLIGKWHLGPMPTYGPLKSGYDEFWGIYGGGVDYFRHSFGGRTDLWDGDTPIEKNGYFTDLLTDRTIDTLDKRKADGRPFFISLHYTAPHWPWEANDDEGRAESDRLAANPGSGAGSLLHYDGGTLETYAGMMKSLDDNVGRLLDRLAALGMAQDTIVVFTSDNGGERFSDTWPFSGKKTELLEGGLRIPTMVRWPGVVRAGSQSDAPVMSMDWLPTFVALGGARPHPDYPADGVDILPALTGGALPDRSLFWRYGIRQQRAHRLGRYKYLKINEHEFLFDVVADPLERGNLKDRQPERFAAMKAAWEAWNGGMLYDPAAPSAGNTPQFWADHFNTPAAAPPAVE